jgi:hypothetical protein
MELFLATFSLSTWVWSHWNYVVPVGSLCVVCVQWCCLGLGGRTHSTWNGTWRWWRSLLPNGTIPLGLVNLSTWVWTHWNHITCWITLCGLCAVVLFGAGSGGRTTPPPGTVLEWWRSLPLYQMELPSWLVQPFHLGLESWNHIGACWILLCGFCAVVLLLGWIWWQNPPPGTVLEGGGGPLLYQMELPIMVGHPSTWVWSLEPCGACWSTLCGFLCSVCYLGLDPVVGPTPPPGTGWKVVEVLTCTKWNYSSWLFTIALGSGPLEPCWCLLDNFVWFCVQWCCLGLDQVVGPHSTTWNGLGRWWRSSSCKWNYSGWSTFPLGSGVTGTMVVCWSTLWFLCSGVVWGWICE